MRDQGKKESSTELSSDVTFWSCLIIIVLLIPLSLFGLMGCSDEIGQTIVPKNKVGCTCKDGTYIVWNENLMKQTSHLTGNPCWDKGGIISYIYNN